MPSVPPVSNNHPEPRGLPPVQPPSGKFIVQLFIIPAVIVAVAVGCIWFVTWLVGGFFTPEQMLKDLRSSNPEVRWRRASDLAQVLKRDPVLAANPTFALDLADMLDQALRENRVSERAFLERLKERSANTREIKTSHEPDKEVRDEREYIQFLIACMGNFSLPVGVPLLKEIAVADSGSDPVTIALRRGAAIVGLANIADNMQQYDKLAPEKQTLLLAKLEEEKNNPSASSLRREGARITLDHLLGRTAGKRDALGVDEVLVRCAADEDRDLRKLTALALTFWVGTPEENQRMENALLKLSSPSEAGEGYARVEEDILRKRSEAGEEVDDPKPPQIRGREIRYQAAQALARRGSGQVKERIPLLLEMLDENELMKLFRVKLKNQSEGPDTAIIGVIVKKTLHSISDLHTKNPDVDVAPFVPAIEKLKASENQELRLEAERTLTVLNPK